MALVVGAVTEQIEVSAEIPQLKTEKTDVATVFTAKEIQDAPIFNRNFTTFQLLSPGAQQQGWGHAASENPQGSQQILTNGQPFAGTAFELDGTDNQDPILGIIVVNPNLESVNEIKITSQDYDAEFGKAIGAVVTSQTRSGTNELHGSIFDFERSNSNFARDPFTQANGVPKGNWNQFGAAVGGPIVKNKLFFFGDFQGQRAHVGGSAQDRIPTAAERAGNLSGIGKNIYDPYQTTDATHQTLVLDGSGVPFRQQVASLVRLEDISALLLSPPLRGCAHSSVPPLCDAALCLRGWMGRHGPFGSYFLYLVPFGTNAESSFCACGRRRSPARRRPPAAAARPPFCDLLLPDQQEAEVEADDGRLREAPGQRPEP